MILELPLTGDFSQQFVTVVGAWFDNLKQKFAEGLSAIELPPFDLPSFNMPSMPSMAEIGAKLGIGNNGRNSTTVNQNVTVTVSTGAAAGATVREIGNSASKTTASNSKKGVSSSILLLDFIKLAHL